MGDETSLERTGIRSDTREPCRQSICEGMGIQTRFGTDETCNAEVHVRARCRGEEANDTCLCKHEFEHGRMAKCHTFEAHMKGCAMLGLKLSRDDGKLAWNSHSDVRSGHNVS